MPMLLHFFMASRLDSCLGRRTTLKELAAAATEASAGRERSWCGQEPLIESESRAAAAAATTTTLLPMKAQARALLLRQRRRLPLACMTVVVAYSFDSCQSLSAVCSWSAA